MTVITPSNFVLQVLTQSCKTVISATCLYSYVATVSISTGISIGRGGSIYITCNPVQA